jgi:hypothetical protein
MKRPKKEQINNIILLLNNEIEKCKENKKEYRYAEQIAYLDGRIHVAEYAVKLIEIYTKTGTKL